MELLEREEVERELGLVKGWIQDTQGLLLSPTADLDTLLSDLEVKRNENNRMFLSVLITHEEFFTSSKHGICEKNVQQLLVVMLLLTFSYCRLLKMRVAETKNAFY